MRTVIQRVKEAEIWIDSERFSQIDRGLLILFGCRHGDQEGSTVWLAEKILNLRIFEDAEQKMNLSLLEISGQIMVVSQFTLYADSRKGRRPAFTEAMEPVEAERLYNAFVARIRSSGLTTQTGVFGAKMEVKLTNDGPVTILLDHDL
ncbi:MAG: D-aminoacyl-tRNA deacylase [candidate division Zixibacteria bacterium]|nr:D-aminoacyl-tRNA deacylase [candidate division Zixibacteria bacterium]